MEGGATPQKRVDPWDGPKGTDPWRRERMVSEKWREEMEEAADWVHPTEEDQEEKHSNKEENHEKKYRGGAPSTKSERESY